MKKEMSSFDVRSVVNEMAVLKDAHMDKIFQWGNNVLLRRPRVQFPPVAPFILTIYDNVIGNRFVEA